ncbi:MAG: hypothetical protein II357_01600 [Clostridia bacterium]|nr:hypothetical protein [Clostridia bacterium]
MKKKLLLLIIPLILFLFTPVPSPVYKDGGTRAYTALTYKIVRWQRLQDSGKVFKKTKVYPFPLNFLTVDELWEKELEEMNP